MFGAPLPIWLFVTIQVCAVILRVIALVMFYILPAISFNLLGFAAFQGMQGELIPFHFGLALIVAVAVSCLLRMLQHQLVDFYDRPLRHSQSSMISVTVLLEVSIGLLLGVTWFLILPWLVVPILLAELAALGLSWWHSRLPYAYLYVG